MSDFSKDDQQRPPADRQPTDSAATRSTDQPRQSGDGSGPHAADAASRSVRGELARDEPTPDSPDREAPDDGTAEEKVDPSDARIDPTNAAEIEVVRGPDGRVHHTNITFGIAVRDDAPGGANGPESKNEDIPGRDATAPEGQDAVQAWKAAGEAVGRTLSGAVRALVGQPTRQPVHESRDSSDRSSSSADATDARGADPASRGTRESVSSSPDAAQRDTGRDKSSTVDKAETSSARSPEKGGKSEVKGTDQIDEFGNRWQVDADGNVTMTGSDGHTIHSSPDGSTTIMNPDGTVISDRPDGRTVSNPDGSFVQVDRDGTSTYTSPTGERLTWSERDEKWIVFDPERHGSRWDRDAETGRWTERDSPHPTRPEGVWSSPDGRTTVTERNGHLFARSDGKESILYGGEPGRTGPAAGQWREVNRETFASTLASNEQLDAEQENPELVAKQAYTDALMAATKRFQETYVQVAEKVAGKFGGPVGIAFERVMDKVRTLDEADRASTAAERMEILASAMDPDLPGGMRSPGRRADQPAHDTPATGRGHEQETRAASAGQKSGDSSTAGGHSGEQHGQLPPGGRVHEEVPDPTAEEWFGVGQPHSGDVSPGGGKDGTPITRPDDPRWGGANVHASPLSHRAGIRESAGASPRGPDFMSATAQTERSGHTAIRADTAEVHSYKRLLGDGEIGLERPQGTNVSGRPDSITARVNADGSVTVFANDAKSSMTGNFPTPASASVQQKGWMADVEAAVAEGRLDLGDPDLEARIRAAVPHGVQLRQLNVDWTTSEVHVTDPRTGRRF